MKAFPLWNYYYNKILFTNQWLSEGKKRAVFRACFPLPGLPKIHEHDGEPAQAYAIFHDGRMVVFYSYQADLGDGWEDPSVHGDPEPLRTAALKMGANLIVWALSR